MVFGFDPTPWITLLTAIITAIGLQIANIIKVYRSHNESTNQHQAVIEQVESLNKKLDAHIVWHNEQEMGAVK